MSDVPQHRPHNGKSNIAGGPVSVFASCLAAAQVQMLKLETAYLCWLLADCNL